MELSQYDIPKSIFFDLLVEDGSLGLAHTEPVSILLDELAPVPFPDPVSEIIPEHSTDDGSEDRQNDMSLPPESTDEDHDIHPRDCCPDDREGFDTCREKCDEIIPASQSLDQLTDPLDPHLDPLGSYERDDDERESEYSKNNREEFRDRFYEKFECLFHVFTLSKRADFAIESTQVLSQAI